MISIIMPYYKKKKFVLEAINSVLKQTYKKFEVIIVDDNSTDNTSKIIKSARNIPNLKIIDQEGTNAYDLLKYKNVVFTTSSIKSFQDRIAK